MLEKTLVIIKPEHIDLASIILRDIDVRMCISGERIKTVRIDKVPRRIAERHYAPLIKKQHYRWVVDSFADNAVVLSVYKGKNIIQKTIDIVGPTDPSKAEPETIRAIYSDDSEAKAITEKRTIWNVVHRSDSLKEAKRELNVWKKYIGVLK